VEPIAELMDEHLDLLDLAERIRRATAAGELAAAASYLVDLARRLDTHVRREERGVFAALRLQGDISEAVEELEQQHVDLAGELTGLEAGAPDFGDRVPRLLDDLTLHIGKENLGIFPMAVVTLGAQGWDIVTRAHAEPASVGEAEVPRLHAPRLAERR
jgi:hemerythrin-like domain-containing protein